MKNCQPLTVHQRTVDWHLLRRFRYIGTVGASICSGDCDIDDSDEWKSTFTDKCVDSWFRRHSSNDFMKQGTANEKFVVQRLGMEDWVKDVFEVGMLQCKKGEMIAVSIQMAYCLDQSIPLMELLWRKMIKLCL